MKKASHFCVVLLSILLSPLLGQAQSPSENVLLAAITGDLGLLQEAIGQGARLDAVDGDGRAPLSVAARGGHVPVLIVLLDKGAPIEAKDNAGMTALMHAAQEGQEAVVPILLDKGAAMEARNKKGTSALMLAAENGHHGVMGMLLERGASPKFAPDEELENTKTADTKENANAALLNAILTHDIAGAEKALALGAKPDCRSKRHIPALIMAASRKQDAIVQALIAAGADPNIRATDTEKGVEQITPLHVASANGDIEILTALLVAGGHVNAQEKHGLTPLMSAAELGHMVPLILLIDHGAELNMQATDGSTALLLAVAQGRTDVATILLEKGADPDIADAEMTTPLMIAAQTGRAEMVQILLDHNADPKLRRGPNGYRAADFAKVSGHKEVVKLLKETP